MHTKVSEALTKQLLIYSTPCSWTNPDSHSNSQHSKALRIPAHQGFPFSERARWSALRSMVSPGYCPSLQQVTHNFLDHLIFTRAWISSGLLCVNSFLKRLAEKLLSSRPWGGSRHSWGPEWDPVRKAVGNFLPLTHLASTWSDTSWVVVMVPRDGPVRQSTQESCTKRSWGWDRNYPSLQQGPGVQNWGLGFS